MLAAVSGDYSGTGALFSGTAAVQLPNSPTGTVKTRGTQRVIPLTVKQVADAFRASSDGSGLVIDGSVRLTGIVIDKIEKQTDVTFTLDDGTGRIVLSRWLNEASDADEMAVIQSGTYAMATCNLKGFQSKGLAVAFSVRLVTDFNYIALHFFECMYVHLDSNKRKVPSFHAIAHSDLTISTTSPYGVKGYQAPFTKQFVSQSVVDVARNEIYTLVLEAFLEPAALSRENGLHLNEVTRRVGSGIPKKQILDAISYHVDMGNIYSTIDEYHFKAARNG